MSRDTISTDSLKEATRSRLKFSGHGDAKGAAGYRIEVEGESSDCEFLSNPGQTAVINPRIIFYCFYKIAYFVHSFTNAYKSFLFQISPSRCVPIKYHMGSCNEVSMKIQGKHIASC